MSDPDTLAAEHCERLHGGSARDCACMLPNEGGWLLCPPEARGILGPAPTPDLPPKPTPLVVAASIDDSASDMALAVRSPVLSGDMCATCGSLSMVRTGTCLTCQNCGDTSGGCS